jgi:hypothetical protein
VVLLDDVVEVLALSQANSARQYAFAFQRSDRSGVSWILIDIDDSRYWIIRRAKYLLSKEPLRSSSIAFGCEQEIDGLPCGVHGSIKILFLALHLYIGFIHAVTLVGGLQMWATSLVQLRCVCLHPAPYAAGIHGKSPFRQQFGHMLVSQRVYRKYQRIAVRITSPESWHPLNGLAAVIDMPYRTKSAHSHFAMEP